MNCYFADTFYYVALANPHDSHHDLAVEWAQLLAEDAHVWTTEAVLLEFANQLSVPALRGVAAGAIRKLQESPDVTIIPLSPDLFERALSLYEQRPDKAWSLTDCLSFVVMQDHGITDALTGDHPFAQAGFRSLLRRETTV